MNKKCPKHPNITAEEQCEFCGEYFCYDCLSTGIAYNYCYKSKCQKAYEKKKEENLKTLHEVCSVDFLDEARKKLKNGTYEAIIIDKILANFEAIKQGGDRIHSSEQINKWEQYLIKKKIIEDPYAQTEEERNVVLLEDYKLLKKAEKLRKHIFNSLFGTKSDG